MATTSPPPDPDPPRRLFLVDGMSHIFRAYYAIRGLTDSQGHPTNAVYGFAAMLRKLIRQHRPDYLAVIFDTEQPTFRHEAYEQYKANRPRMPEDLASQLPVIREFCQAMQIPILQLDRFEADDIIGTLARQAGENRWETTIVSNDKDMFQLVNDRTRVLHQSKTDTLFDASRVEEFFGVAPERVVDVLGLMGDSVDNVPGAPGIGSKGARDLVHRFGSLEALLDQSEQVTRKTYRESLRNHREQILQSKELVTIDTAVPIDFSWENLQVREPDPDRLRPLLAQLGFQSMLKEMEGDAPPAREEPVDFQPLASPRQLRTLMEQARSVPSCTCWLETDPEDSLCRSPRRLAVLAGESGWILDLEDGASPGLEDLREFWEDPEIGKVFYDAKPAHLVSRHLGLELKGLRGDAMLISYLLQPNRSNHGLGEIAFALLGEEAPAEAGGRCATVQRLNGKLQPRLEASGLEQAYREIDLPLVEVLAELEWNGIRVDSAVLRKMSEDFEQTAQSLTRRIYEVAGTEFNLNSPKQLGEILFDRLNLPTPRRLRKSGQYSTSVEVLEHLAKDYEVPRLMLEYRRIAKLKSGYVDALPRLVDPSDPAGSSLLPPDRGRYRPAVMQQSQPAEHPHPLRARRTDPVGFRGGRGLPVAVGGLFANRTENPGPSFPGPCAARCLPEERGHPHPDRQRGVRHRSPAPDRRDAPARQGHQLRHHLRPDGLRPGQGAADLPPRRPGIHPALLRTVSSGVKEFISRRFRSKPGRAG